MTKLDDVVDLQPMRRSVWRLTQKLIDQREAIHTCSNLPQ